MAEQPMDADRAALHKYGYAQQLLRDMGGFSNFAISFSIISILTGAVLLYGHGLNNGGPVVMGLGWPIVTFFVLMVSAGLAELASAIPTSGACYHWSALLGGAGWGWFTAWLNLIGLVAAIAGIDYGCAQFIAPLLGLKPDTSTVLSLFTLVLVSHAVLNHVGIRVVARLNDISAVYHVGGVVVILLAVLFFAPKQPVSVLFTQTYTGGSDRPYWMLFLVGLLQAQWTFTGYDASAHTIEETRDARVRAPWGIFLSVAVSGLFGYLMICGVTLAIQNLPQVAGAENPFLAVFHTALGSRGGTAVAWMVGIAQWFCGLSCLTATSRMIFAFARDRGTPAHALLSVVSPRFRTPVAAVWTAAALAYLLPRIVLAFTVVRGHLDFSTVFAAVTGISTVALYLSYGIPLLLRLAARRRGTWTAEADGPWSLGSWSVPVNVLALVWIAFITVLFVVPPSELTGYVFGGTLLLLTVLYFATARGRFTGPVPQAASEEELLAMEARLESGSTAAE